VKVQKDEPAARAETAADPGAPAVDVREPADRAVAHEGYVEGGLVRFEPVEDVAADEARGDAALLGEPPRELDRLVADVHAGRPRAERRDDGERILPGVALEVDEVEIAHVAEELDLLLKERRPPIAEERGLVALVRVVLSRCPIPGCAVRFVQFPMVLVRVVRHARSVSIRRRSDELLLAGPVGRACLPFL